MKQFEYTIIDPLGIHARPAGMLAKIAKEYADTVITVAKAGNTAKASQLMKIMSLCVKQGDVVEISAEGPAEEEAIEAMRSFFENNL